MIGDTLGGYQIIEEIGAGGMATVYKAYDPRTDRHVAIKVLPDHYSGNVSFRERFQREARAIARLEHVHILPIFGYGEEERRAYLVMRYMPTGTLVDVLQEGPMPLEEASRLLTQMASALDTAHEQGVIHRDVKPSNILLDKQGNIYLSDFGIAKLMEDSQHLTGSGIIGTPPYMSPEQCAGSKSLTGASDQYALAVIVYRMVTGMLPYDGETPVAVIMKHINSPLPDPRDYRPDLSEEAAQVIQRALAKNPEERFTTCSEFAGAFARVLSGATVVSVLAPLHAQPTKPIQDEEFESYRTLPAQTQIASQRASAFPKWIAAAAIVLLIAIAAVMLLRALPQQVAEQETGTSEPSVEAPTDQAPEPATDVPVIVPDNTDLSPTPIPATQTPDPLDSVEVLAVCLGQVCINEPNGTSIIVPFTADYTLMDGMITWSPDGSQITFAACEGKVSSCSSTRVYIMNRDGTDIHAISPLNTRNPAWSPDGEWIAYLDGCMVKIMRPDGTDTRTIYNGLGCSSLPAWSPDSQSIAWIEAEPGGSDLIPAVWVARIDGTEVYPIYYDLNVSIRWQMIGWSPDGASVAVQAMEFAYLLDASCDVQESAADCVAARETLDGYPQHWTHAYFPMWAGAAVGDLP